MPCSVYYTIWCVLLSVIVKLDEVYRFRPSVCVGVLANYSGLLIDGIGKVLPCYEIKFNQTRYTAKISSFTISNTYIDVCFMMVLIIWVSFCKF
jgi:hypothetical protein